VQGEGGVERARRAGALLLRRHLLSSGRYGAGAAPALAAVYGR
jgi:hypothetical protein